MGDERPIKILLVEDDPKCRIPTRLLLQRRGFQVTEAENGSAALAAIAALGEPDVILLDVSMPVMDGREFLKQYGGPAEVIVLSAWASDLVGELKGRTRGPLHFMPKPFVSEDLVWLIEGAVQRSP